MYQQICFCVCVRVCVCVCWYKHECDSYLIRDLQSRENVLCESCLERLRATAAGTVLCMSERGTHQAMRWEGGVTKLTYFNIQMLYLNGIFKYLEIHHENRYSNADPVTKTTQKST